MKKTFRSILAGAVALLAVSCYDDLALREEISKLDERVTAIENTLNAEVGGINSLASRLAAVEEGLASGTADLEELLGNFDALEDNVQAMLTRFDGVDGDIDGIIADLDAAVKELKDADKALKDEDFRLAQELAKIAVVNVAEVAGKVVLTLADGSLVEVSKPLTNADNNGLVTVVKTEEGEFWAVIKDGAAESLGIPVGHPDYEFEFTVASNGELQYSVNGGEPVGTGVSTSDISGQKYIITDIVENDDNVVIKIGDASYTLPKYVPEKGVLNLSRTDFFLRYGGQKTIEIDSENLSDVYVMSKPDGWKAVLEGNMLTVTAPTKNAIAADAAEEEGQVLLHANGADGKCIIAKLEVVAGKGLVLSVDNKGNITVENSYYGESADMWGNVSFGFKDFILGVATPETFLKDPAAYVGVYNSIWSAPDYDIIFPSMYNVADMGIYEEGVYETDIVKSTVADVWFSWYYEDLPAGGHYVVWIAPVDAEGKAVIEDIEYAEYVNVTHDVQVTAVTHSDITLSLNCVGAQSYVINCVAESYYNSEWNPMTFDDYMMSPYGGPWTGFQNYGAVDALGMVYPAEELPAELKLSDLLGEKLAAGENYKIWVMPLFDHKNILDEEQSYPEEDYYVYDYSAYDYTNDFLPYVFDETTNELEAGGAYAATYTLSSKDFKNIYVDVTVAEGTESVYYNWYSVEDYAMFENDDQIMADIMANCYFPLSGNDQVSKAYANPGESWILASVSVGVDGKYGEIVEDTFSTKPIPTTSDLTVSLVSVVDDGTNYTVKVAVSGASRVMGYHITDDDYNRTTFPTNVAVNGHKSTYSNYQFAEVVDGEATLTFVKSDYKTHYYVAGLNVEDGAVSAITEDFLVIDLSTAVPAN